MVSTTISTAEIVAEKVPVSETSKTNFCGSVTSCNVPFSSAAFSTVRFKLFAPCVVMSPLKLPSNCLIFLLLV